MPHFAGSTQRKLRPARRQTHNRWCLQPVLLRDPDAFEPFEGGAILDETPGDLGLLLWQTYRDGLLWASTEPSIRPHLFSGGVLLRRGLLIQTSGVEGETRVSLELLS